MSCPVTVMPPKKAKISDLNATQKKHYQFLKSRYDELTAIRYLQLLAKKQNP